MQLGIRLHDVVKLPLEERLPVVKEQGFQCVHLALSKVMPSKKYSAVESLTPGYAMYLKKLFAKNDQDIAVLGCYLNLAHPDQDKYEEILNTYKCHIRFASLLGCGVVGTETGAVNAEYKFEEANRSMEALDLFVERLRPVVEYAEKMGVIVAIEPVRKHIVYTPERARYVLDQIASPNLQIILDPVNLLDVDNYENQDEVVKNAIDLLGKDVAMVHIKDYVVEDNQLKAVGAGLGNMNYEQVIRFIKERKPYIHVTLENTLPENAVACRKHIQAMWDEMEA